MLVLPKLIVDSFLCHFSFVFYRHFLLLLAVMIMKVDSVIGFFLVSRFYLPNQPKGVRFLRKLPAKSHDSPSHPSRLGLMRARFDFATICSTSSAVVIVPLLILTNFLLFLLPLIHFHVTVLRIFVVNLLHSVITSSLTTSNATRLGTLL